MDCTGTILFLLFIFVVSARSAMKLGSKGYEKFDKDGTVHDAAKEVAKDWIRRKFGK